jgi:hypothetical protein
LQVEEGDIRDRIVDDWQRIRDDIAAVAASSEDTLNDLRSLERKFAEAQDQAPNLGQEDVPSEEEV